MSVALLDVNVLIAFAWPTHVHHRLIREWMIRHRDDGWATCPLTESGFARISSNPKILPNAVEPQEAITLLRHMAEMPGHHFWPDELSLRIGTPAVARAMGHRQITDAYLLDLAAAHQGRLVTLDRNIKALLPLGNEYETALEIIDTSGA